MVIIFDFMKKKQKVKRGRRPIEDKKVHLPLYVPQSTIELLGREKAIEAGYKGIRKEMAELNTTN